MRRRVVQPRRDDDLPKSRNHGEGRRRAPASHDRLSPRSNVPRLLAALDESQESLRTLFNSVYDAVFLHEVDGRIIDVNEPTLRMYCLSYDEALSLSIERDLSAPTNPIDGLPELWRSVMSGHPQFFQWKARRPHDGSLFDVEVYLRKIRLGGRDLIMANVRDISERKATESSLQAANRAKDHFMAVLSHELRTPLTPVLAAAGTLETDPRLPEDVRNDLAMIRRNVELEARLIDDLLDLTRVSRGVLQLQIHPVDLREKLRCVLEICSMELDAKAQQVCMEIEPGPLWINADGARLQQVLWNLLRNAIKYSPVNGRIIVRCSRCAQPRPSIVIEVIDHGVGIDPGMLKRLFHAFERGDHTGALQFGGLGLGLSISRALVELHGGTIAAHSAGRGQGATFTVVLPAAERLADSDLAPPASATPQQAPSTRILMVEDHPDTARLMSRLLRCEGFEVVVATDVASALSAAAEQDFDLLLSDLGLPDGSGHDVMRKLRPMPGIALSGYGMDHDIERSLAAGFAEHLTKPVNFDHLRDSILRLARPPLRHAV